MAKGTNAKIKELKGIKPEKIEDQELTDLQAIIRNTDRLTADIGRIETQKYAMLVGMGKIQEEIDAKRTEFLEKYGSDNINIQTGEIAYPEETSNIEENGEVNKED
tara:strand:+ start:907 stop:1224 length:318 start_codon:yes stop_codon:yes gene_type:complete